jgi:hypothetical protein
VGTRRDRQQGAEDRLVQEDLVKLIATGLRLELTVAHQGREVLEPPGHRPSAGSTEKAWVL